jgi:hypothetical protein
VTSSDGSDRRNLSHEDFEFEGYDEFLSARLERFFPHDCITPVSHDWDYVLDVRPLYRHGLFGILLRSIDREPTRGEWNHLRDADCPRCGKPDVGIYGLFEAVQGPDGERYSIHQEETLCEDCRETVLDELREYGERQPTMGVFA